MGKKKKREVVSDGNFSPAVQTSTRLIAKDLMTLCLQDCQPGKYAAYFEQLFNQSEKLLHLQKDYSLVSRAALHPRNVEDLHAFIGARHCPERKFAIQSFDNEGYGLMTTLPITKHEELLRIPRSSILTSESALSSQFNIFFKTDPIASKMANVSLTLFLLCQLSLGSESQWSAYIASLPTQLDTLLYLTPHNLARLKGSPVLETAVRQYQNICRQYAYFSDQMETSSTARCLPIGRAFCFEDYRWAVSIVMSRNNPVPRPLSSDQLEHEFDLALIPLWDMINHKAGQMTTDFDVEAGTIVLYAMEDTQPGEQIYMDYGKRTNAEFLLYSGFVPQDNPNDNLPIKLGISSQDPLHARKTALLARFSLSGSHVCRLDSQRELPVDLATFSRIFVMKADDLDRYLAMTDDQLKSSPVTSQLCGRESGDAAAVSFLATRLKLLLAAYDCTIEEDKAHLSLPNEPLSKAERGCIQLRLAEKLILNNTLQRLEQREI